MFGKWKAFIAYCLLLLLLRTNIARSSSSISTETAKRYPCAYQHTIDITEGLRLQDGSYSIEGLVIPANLVADYDFKVIDGIEYGTPNHRRACVCLLKPCITFCCPLGMIFDEKNQNCSRRVSSMNAGQDVASNVARPGHIKISNSDGSFNVVSIAEAFAIRYEFGCKNKLIDREDWEFWKWELYANGSMLRDSRLLSTDEYCFTPLEFENAWSLTPLTCVRHQRGFRVWIYVICLALAVLINSIVAGLLIWVRRIRSSNFGETLIFYLISTVIGYTTLAYLSAKNPMNLTQTACKSLGFIAYYFMMISFLLLNFISLEFWRKFQLKTWRGWLRKVIYAFMVLLTFALKFGVKYAQDSNMPQYLKPGIGDSVCWFDVRLLGILIYYYLPVILSLALSIFFCFKAYMAIWELPDEEEEEEGSDIWTTELKMTKSHFYGFLAYMIGIASITVREVIVWSAARLRQHFFIIDFWSGFCVLCLAITGFICFAVKNKLMRSWLSSKVSNDSADLAGMPSPIYRLDSLVDYNHQGKHQTTFNDEAEKTALK